VFAGALLRILVILMVFLRVEVSERTVFHGT
jgi:hypothetical protein